MIWSIAVMDGRGRVLLYLSNAPHSIEGPLWRHAEDPRPVQCAWADAMAGDQPVPYDAVARASGRTVVGQITRLPEGSASLAFGQWGFAGLLSSREAEVCRRLVDGQPVDQIAAGLKISSQAVNRYRRTAMEKLGCRTYEQLGALLAVYQVRPPESLGG